MAALTINGVDFPVAIDSLRYSPEHVGMAMTRNANGILVGDRRVMRSKLSFSTALRPLDETMLYLELLQARGDYWPLKSDSYSNKGLQITGTGSYTSSSWRLTTGTTMIVPHPIQTQDALIPDGTNEEAAAGRDGFTLLGHRLGGTARVFAWTFAESDTSSASLKREVLFSGGWGSPQTYTGDDTVVNTPSTSLLTVTGGTTTTNFSRLWWIPRRFLQAQIDTLLTALTTLSIPYGGTSYPWHHPPTPRLRVWMDVFPASLYYQSGLYYKRNIVAIGEVTDFIVQPAMNEGSYSQTMSRITANLIEA